MTLTDAERQFIESMRQMKPTEKFSLAVRLEDGAWEIDMSIGNLKARGIGRTFSAAWDNVTGLQFW